PGKRQAEPRGPRQVDEPSRARRLRPLARLRPPPGEERREEERPRRQLGASRHRLKTDERRQPRARPVPAQARPRERSDRRQIDPATEVVPVHGERRGEAAGGERRGPDERAGVGDGLLLQEAPGSPRPDREVEQQEKTRRQGGGGKEKEQRGRIEDTRLAVGQPGL